LGSRHHVETTFFASLSIIVGELIHFHNLWCSFAAWLANGFVQKNSGQSKALFSGLRLTAVSLHSFT